jgi:hypothetical protein
MTSIKFPLHIFLMVLRVTCKIFEVAVRQLVYYPAIIAACLIMAVVLTDTRGLSAKGFADFFFEAADSATPTAAGTYLVPQCAPAKVSAITHPSACPKIAVSRDVAVSRLATTLWSLYQFLVFFGVIASLFLWIIFPESRLGELRDAIRIPTPIQPPASAAGGGMQ